MKGTNEIRLNAASMNAAIQEWVDAHMKDKQKVLDVSYNSAACMFVVKVAIEPVMTK